jgi:hypothetical protein
VTGCDARRVRRVLRGRSQFDSDPDQGASVGAEPSRRRIAHRVGSYSKVWLVRQRRLTRNRAAQDKKETRGRLFERSEFTASPVWPSTRGNPKGCASERMLLLTFRGRKVRRMRAAARVKI